MADRTPRLSVVIPSYNHERYVGRAVRSVLSQELDGEGAIELVVIDDGSRDGTPDAVRGAMADFPGADARMIEQENRGAHEAIMRGIDESSGPVLAILNSDDAYLPGRFGALLPHVEGTRFGLAFSGLRTIDDDDQPLADGGAWPTWYRGACAEADRNPTIGLALWVQNFSVTSGNFVFTRELYKCLDGFSTHKFVHDWDFLMRSTLLCEPSFVRDTLMEYRVHATNTTEGVRDLLADECREIVGRYLSLASGLDRDHPFDGEGRADPSERNSLALHPSAWPGYFDRFVSSRATLFDGAPLAAHLGRDRFEAVLPA
ncbi:MAG: glycosyltransferase family 2 protein [Planctomycetota bacterium]